jgi:cardiolipin synthase
VKPYHLFGGLSAASSYPCAFPGSDREGWPGALYRADDNPAFSMSTSVFTIANLLTILRLILIPFFVTSIFYQRFLLALMIFFMAAITDGLDGLVARTFNQKTPLGEILDPMADKLLLVTAFIVLSLPRFTLLPPLPFWLTAAVISRDVFIVLGALVINIATGFSQFRPSVPGKINTLVQVVTIVLFLTANVTHLLEDWLPIIYLLALGMTIFSGLHYLFHVNHLMREENQRNDEATTEQSSDGTDPSR